MPRTTPQARALALADDLDRQENAGPDFQELAVLDDLGFVLHRQEGQAFRAALEAKLIDVADDVQADQGRQWDLRQEYPHTWGGILRSEGADAADVFATEFVATAERLMRPFRYPAVAA
jgi:hypothetical protein